MTLIYLVAGEQSGDALGAKLILALRAARPDLKFAGVGGPQMEAVGLPSLFSITELAVMGLLEVLPRIRHIAGLLRATEQDILARRPDVVVTIDSPGFTLRLLGRLRTSGLKRIHYVAPQVWAWRESRVKKYPGLWDRLLCLLPFEPEFFAGHGIAARFVGHPAINAGVENGDAARFRARHGIAGDAPILMVLPGSRRSEVSRLLPIFADVARRLALRHPGLVIVVPVASAVAKAVLAGTKSWPTPPVIGTDFADKIDGFAAATAALTKSGTSTLELALANVPMVVAYLLNPITAAIVRATVRVKYASIVNLLLDRFLAPEFIQGDCTVANLTAATDALLAGDGVAAQRAGFTALRALLTPPGQTPSEAAAAEVLALLRT
ncbi:MAG: lipid-A-disaccharide synthase [Acetobacteraceae bacterium]|nr:lipid-A-disaccharide synthase [Acetobacteraceae bacterium]